MNKQKINQIIGQIEKSIEEIEPHLNEEEFKDYCDNIYSIIFYWKQQIKFCSK